MPLGFFMPSPLYKCMSYADGDDFIVRYDTRLVGKLLSDTGTAVVAPQNSDDLAVYLEQASGEVEAACFAGERYTADDLTNLEGNSLALLKGLVCALAFWLMLQRRGESLDKYPHVEQQLTLLDQLRNGARVFNVAAVLDSGHGKTQVISANETARLNLERDRNQMYPVRRYPEGA